MITSSRGAIDTHLLSASRISRDFGRGRGGRGQMDLAWTGCETVREQAGRDVTSLPESQQPYRRCERRGGSATAGRG